MKKKEIIELLNLPIDKSNELFERAKKIKEKYIGNKVHLRGLIEYSNICAKDCYYCGIRKSNKKTTRYTMTKEEVLEAAQFAINEKYASIVIQAGEIDSPQNTATIAELLQKINTMSNQQLGITLSLGEQSEKTLTTWRNAGAHRYLLRIETSNKNLYNQIHPQTPHHNYENRLENIRTLQKLDYQVGTGVMIGLPGQTIENLADDLLFFKNSDIDMIGMGPYIEHSETPLYAQRETLLPANERFHLSLKMLAILRIMMKDINIAATTAMQTLDAIGREKAINAGANILMPNLTPVKYRKNYILYENKVCVEEAAIKCKHCLEKRLASIGTVIGYEEQGNSKHYSAKKH